MPTGDTNWSPLFSRMQPGGFFVAQNMPEHPNNVWFVGSAAANASDSTSSGRNPNTPFATLDYAVSHASVATGDTFYILPGHAENLAADSAVDIDVSNLHIIGLGWGGCRPTFTCTAIAGDFKLAASCGILENILFVNAIDASTGLLEISTSDWTLRNIEIREADSTAAQATVYISHTAGVRTYFDGLIINEGGADAGPARAIDFTEANDLHMQNFRIYGNFSTGAINFAGTASLRVKIQKGQIWTENAADICIVDTVTGSSGVIGPDLELVLQDDAANITEAVTGATFYVADPVYVVNAVAEKAMLINWTASTD